MVFTRMNFIKQIPKPVIGNILFLTYIIIALIGGIVFRHNSPVWGEMEGVRLEYDLFFGVGLSTLCIIVIIGLLLRKEWGWYFAISLNFVLLFIHCIFRVGLYVFTRASYGKGLAIVDLDAIFISILSLTFLILLTKSKTKEFFKKKR